MLLVKSTCAANSLHLPDMMMLHMVWIHCHQLHAILQQATVRATNYMPASHHLHATLSQFTCHPDNVSMPPSMCDAASKQPMPPATHHPATVSPCRRLYATMTPFRVRETALPHRSIVHRLVHSSNSFFYCFEMLLCPAIFCVLFCNFRYNPTVEAIQQLGNISATTYAANIFLNFFIIFLP